MQALSTLLLLLLALALAATSTRTHAFAFGGGATRVARASSRGGSSLVAHAVRARRDLTVALAKPKPAEESEFWQGEWVCADCGYIYDADDCGGLAFEQQKKGWVCPQCRGPRRRFAKKVGDQVGITQDGGDAPILLFSFLGLAGTVAFAFWFSNTQ